MLKRYKLSLLCMVVIWYLSFFTPPPVDLDPELNADKLVHTAMYGGWCFLIWAETLWARRKHRALFPLPLNMRNMFVWALCLPTLMGGVIEILQENCTNHRRSGDWWDFAANTLGVLLMYGIGYLWQKHLKRD